MKHAAYFLVLTGLLLAAPARAEGDMPADIAIRSTPAGDYLTDAKGMALYTYDSDGQANGGSACNDRCALQWPPLLAPETAMPDGRWSVIRRADGRTQWEYKDRPLYLFAKDDRPGATYGDGVRKLWHVVFEPRPTPPGIGVLPTLKGQVLVDVRGHTLYVRDGEVADKKSLCTENCLDTWQPLPAPTIAVGFGDWSLVARTESYQQWAFKGRPLYTYAGDDQPGDTAGDGADKHWRAMTLGAAPGVPAFVTVQNSDFGRILADAEGKTLYAFAADEEKVRRESCNDACWAEHWKPALAGANDESVDQWSVVARPDGTRQWALRGDLVYTYARDFRVGDTSGFRAFTGNGASGDAFVPLQQANLIVAP